MPKQAESSLAANSLRRRFAWVTAARLSVLIILLGLLGLLDRFGRFSIGSFTFQTSLVTLASAFAVTAFLGLMLRSNRGLGWIVPAQLVCDQLLWTVVVYLTGGAASGATSLYGFSCLIGAILAGFRGAGTAGVAGVVSFLGLLTALHSDWLQPPPDQPPALYHASTEELIYSGVANVLVIVVVVLLAGNLSERLRITGGQLILAEQRADHAERLAALGRLAAGLAHEIRNPLSSITGSIQLLRSQSGLSAEDRQLCNIIQREAVRLNDLVSDMVDLSRPRRPQLAVVDVVNVAQEVVRLASESGRAASDVEIVFHTAVQQARVLADGAQLRQLIWNLVRNAVQASSAENQVILQIDVSAANEVTLLVQDFGIGLSPEAQARIFDAFYTTRSQGTGIGLAVVKRIADDHGFEIEVDSDVGKGARFLIRLGMSVNAAIGAHGSENSSWSTPPIPKNS